MKADSSHVADLLGSPKARWALAWLAAPAGSAHPADSYDAADIHPARSRLHALRDNPAGLLAEIHTRVEDWRYQHTAHTAVASLGPPEGYTRIAEALLAAPAAAWWYQPPRRDAQTWICHDPGISRGRGLPFVTGYGHHWDSTAPARSVVTSTRLPRLPAAALLADLTLAPGRRPDPATLSAWDVAINDSARIYEIHSPADWTNLVQRYPSHRTDLCQAPALVRDWPARQLIWTPDWRAVAHDHDSVHLSVAGWLTATSRILDVPGRGNTFCEGWLTESSVWFRPAFQPFTRLSDTGLEYGYGRPCAGSQIDLTIGAAATSWWGRLLRWARCRR